MRSVRHPRAAAACQTARSHGRAAGVERDVLVRQSVADRNRPVGAERLARSLEPVSMTKLA